MPQRTARLVMSGAASGRPRPLTAIFFTSCLLCWVVCGVLPAGGSVSRVLEVLKDEELHRRTFGLPLREDPEVHMNVTQLITSKGYPCEEHTVMTADGFLLGIQRIPGPRHALRHKAGQRVPVLLQHGLLCSATNWVANPANESLAFLLADAGYDVWLGNSRGNTYSRRHVTFSPQDTEFWDWSWDEMGRYDLPAVVDHVLGVTGAPQLTYVAHSQGTLLAFAALSSDPKLASKVKQFFALGPVTTVGNITSPIRYLAGFPDFEMRLLLGKRDFLPNDDIIKFLARTFCSADTRIFCADVLFLIAGFDLKELNQTRLPVYLSHTPAGTSTRNIVHFAQMVRHGRFQMYDYGDCFSNYRHYGQCSPPLYDVSRVTVPTVLFYGQDDTLADPTDVDGLILKLPNLLESVFLPSWDHLDFIWGIHARHLVYDPIIKMIAEAEALTAGGGVS